MSKVTERTYFDHVWFCPECGWFQQPWTVGVVGPRLCCYACGGKLELKVGALRTRETRRFLCDTHTEYLSFTPRIPQP